MRVFTRSERTARHEGHFRYHIIAYDDRSLPSTQDIGPFFYELLRTGN